MITEVGNKVEGLKPGDLVVPSVRRPCSEPHCAPCQADLQDFCATGDFVERGIKMSHGFMTEFYTERDKYLHVVPPSLRDVAVLVEPLTIAEKAMAQVWPIQTRLPWVKHHHENGKPSGRGLNAVVLGAGPVGILGAMKLKAKGSTRSSTQEARRPIPRPAWWNLSAFPTSLRWIPLWRRWRSGSAASISSTRRWVFHPLPTRSCRFGAQWHLCLHRDTRPKAPIEVDADLIMRNVVLKNQVVVGTVNADGQAFRSAISDLGVFMEKWPEALKSSSVGAAPSTKAGNCFWTRQLASRMSFALRRPESPFRVPDAALGTAQSITRNSF